MTKQILVTACLALTALVGTAKADELSFLINESHGWGAIEEIDLANQHVVCGYGDVHSDINRDLYADKVCKYFQLGPSVGHECGRSIYDDVSEAHMLTVDPVTDRPAIVPFHELPGRKVGFYARIFCLKPKK